MPQDYIKDVLEGRSLSPEQDVTGTHIAPQKLPFSQGFAAMVGQGYYQNFFYSASSYLSKISYGIRAGSDAKQWVSPEKAKEEYGLNVDDFVPMKWAESAKGTRLKVERLQQIAQKSELAGDVVVPFLAQSLGYLADPTILATGIFNFKSAIGLGKVLSNVGRANRLAIQKASFIGTEATTLGASVLGEEFHATDIGLKESPEFKNVAFAVGLGLIPIGFAAKSLKKFSPPSRKELVKEADNIIEGILSGQRRDIRSALEGIKTSNLVDEGVPYITGSKRVSGMVESLTDIAEGGTKEASSFFDNFTNKVGKVFDELEKNPKYKQIIEQKGRVPEILDQISEKEFVKAFKGGFGDVFKKSKKFSGELFQDIKEKVPKLKDFEGTTDNILSKVENKAEALAQKYPKAAEKIIDFFGTTPKSSFSPDDFSKILKSVDDFRNSKMFNDLLDKTGKGIIKASEKLEKVLTLPDKGLEKIFGDMTVGELQNLLLDKTGKGIIKASEKLEKVLTLPDKGLEKIFGDMTVGELQQKIKEKVPKLKNFEGVKSQKGGIGTEFASAGGIGALTVGALAIKKFKENPSSLNTFEENTKRLQEQVNFIKSNYTLGTTDDPDSVEAAKQLTQIRNVIEEVKSKEKLSKKQINSFNKILESIEKITGPVKGKA